MHKDCDCTCHPENGMVKEQRKWQFGTMKIGWDEKEVPVWCCWCHYDNDSLGN